jgi:hypothetical protein
LWRIQQETNAFSISTVDCHRIECFSIRNLFFQNPESTFDILRTFRWSCSLGTSSILVVVVFNRRQDLIPSSHQWIQRMNHLESEVLGGHLTY